MPGGGPRGQGDRRRSPERVRPRTGSPGARRRCRSGSSGPVGRQQAGSAPRRSPSAPVEAWTRSRRRPGTGASRGRPSGPNRGRRPRPPPGRPREAVPGHPPRSPPGDRPRSPEVPWHGSRPRRRVPPSPAAARRATPTRTGGSARRASGLPKRSIEQPPGSRPRPSGRCDHGRASGPSGEKPATDRREPQKLQNPSSSIPSPVAFQKA